MIWSRSPKKTQMVLDLRQRAETPSGSEATEVSLTAKAKKNGSRRANEVVQCKYLIPMNAKYCS